MQTKTCPRCQSSFVCHHDDDITLCQCSSIRLTKGANLHLQLSYSGQCLCLNCLRQLNTLFPE